MKVNVTHTVATLALAAGIAVAGDYRDFTLRVAGTGSVSETLVIRGQLAAIEVKTVDGGALQGTNPLLIKTEEQTLLQISNVGNVTNVYRPVYQAHTYTGANAVFDTTNSVYVPTVLAGPVTVQLTSGNNANTNTFRVRIIYRR